MSTWMDNVSALARKKLNKPENWSTFRYEGLDDGSIVVTGALHRLKESGAYKGQKTWTMKDGKMYDRATCTVTKEESDAC